MKTKLLSLLIASIMLSSNMAWAESDTFQKYKPNMPDEKAESMADEVSNLEEENDFEAAFKLQVKLTNQDKTEKNYEKLQELFFNISSEQKERYRVLYNDNIVNANALFPTNAKFLNNACWIGLKKDLLTKANSICTEAYKQGSDSFANVINYAHIKYFQGDKKAFEKLLAEALSLVAESSFEELKADFTILSTLYTPKEAKRITDDIDKAWQKTWHNFAKLTKERLEYNQNKEYKKALDITLKQQNVVEKQFGKQSLRFAYLLENQAYYEDKLKNYKSAAIAADGAYRVYKGLNVLDFGAAKHNTEALIENYLLKTRNYTRIFQLMSSTKNDNQLYITWGNKDFRVNKDLVDKYGTLIHLILNTESMDDDERQYWFDIMPSMTSNQVDRLYKILQREKVLIALLERKYRFEIRALNAKHLLRLAKTNTGRDVKINEEDKFIGENFDRLTNYDINEVSLHDIQKLKNEFINKFGQSSKFDYHIFSVLNQDIARKYYQLGLLDNYETTLNEIELTVAKEIEQIIEDENIDIFELKNPILDDFLKNKIYLSDQLYQSNNIKSSVNKIKPYLRYLNYYENSDENKDKLLYLLGNAIYAKSLLANGEKLDADEYFKKSIDVINALKIKPYSLSTEDSNNFILQPNPYEIYLNYIQLLVSSADENDNGSAFALSEQSRARYLLNQLTKNRAIENSGIPTQKARQLKDLSQLITKIEADIETQPTKEKGLLEQLKKTNDEYDKLDAKLKSNYPKYAQLTQVNTVNKSEAVKTLPTDSTFLSYMYYNNPFEQKAATFGLTKSGELSAKIPDFSDIDKLAESYRWFHALTNSAELAQEDGLKLYLYRNQVLLTQKDNAPKSARDGYQLKFYDAYRQQALRDIGNELSELLLKPYESQIDNSKRLIIAPDGLLATIPWDALPYKEGRLSDYVDVTLTQSLSVYKLLKDREAAYAERGEKGESLLVVGDAVYNTNEAKKDCSLDNVLGNADILLAKKGGAVSSIEESEAQTQDAYRHMLGSNWSNLACTLPEVSYISKLMQGDEITGKQASEKTIRALSAQDKLNSYKRIHFSAHGYLNTAYPSLSSLVLTKTGEDTTEDGYITAGEWPALNLKSDLLVMSACETALGKVVKGEGVQGLPYALYVAGNRDTLLTLWKVSDAVTALFMQKFWNKVHAGMSHHEALAQTKREFSQGKVDPRFTDPYYWSGFVLYGI